MNRESINNPFIKQRDMTHDFHPFTFDLIVQFLPIEDHITLAWCCTNFRERQRDLVATVRLLIQFGPNYRDLLPYFWRTNNAQIARLICQRTPPAQREKYAESLYDFISFLLPTRSIDLGEFNNDETADDSPVCGQLRKACRDVFAGNIHPNQFISFLKDCEGLYVPDAHRVFLQCIYFPKLIEDVSSVIAFMM